jgi:hypothetical protein
MIHLPDVNVLIALGDSNHPHYAAGESVAMKSPA